jgi:hypothetical protein
LKRARDGTSNCSISFARTYSKKFLGGKFDKTYFSPKKNIKVNLSQYYSFKWKKIRVSLILLGDFPDIWLLNPLVHLGPELQEDSAYGQVQELQAEHVPEDDRDDSPSGPGGGRDRERQVQCFQKQAEHLEKWLKENDPKYGTRGQEISSNLMDNESAAEAHGVIQGYNSQALIYGKHQVMFMSRSSAGVRITRLRTASAVRR